MLIFFIGELKNLCKIPRNKEDKVIVFVKKYKDNLKDVNQIVTYPWNPRKYVYLFLMYMKLMYGIDDYVIYTDNVSDCMLQSYLPKVKIYLLEPLKNEFRLIEQFCGILPFDVDEIGTEQIAKQCHELVKEIRKEK
jgi:hypothetical protein